MRSLFSTANHYDGAALRGAVASLMMLGLISPAAVYAAGQHDSSWGIGLGVGSSQQAYTDIDRDTTPLPIVTFENKYIKLSGPELAFKLPSYELNDSNTFNFSIVGKYEFIGYEEDDARILNGMEDRDGGLWAGFRAEWQNSFADLSAEFSTDVSGDSDGSSFNLGIERTWHFKEQFMFTPRVAVNWLDDSYIDYYYGVRKNEVNAGRAYYKGEAGVNVEVGARGGYMFGQKHFVFLDVGVKQLASEIKDSPLVDRSTENSVALGYIYRF